LIHSYGPQNKDKVKEPANENHQLDKVVEMKGINDFFVHVGFLRTETKKLKNRNGKCEGPGKWGSTS
jgi:hypothetical protein